MDLRIEKYDLVKRILNLSDERLIEAIKTLLDRTENNPEGRISIEQYNRELEEAEKDYAENGGVSLEEVRKKIKAA
jgi:hypothetical protein